MLREIRIRGLGVIDDAVLELSPGLNVLTGETGAGKTMVVSGLGLLLGARADASMVRQGSSTASVEGLVEIDCDHPAARRAAEAGADVADGLILARTVSAEGRSRAHVGGRSAPVSVLGELGEHLVAVHGQADQSRLRQPDQHRVLLDRFGGELVEAPWRLYTALYDEHRRLRAERQRLRDVGRDRTRELDALVAGLEEIEKVDPRSGEEEELRAEDERLAHADQLRAAVGLARARLTGEVTSPLAVSDDDGLGGSARGADGAAGDVVALLSEARAALSAASAHDATLAEVERRAAELTYLAADLGGDLAAYLADVEADPARLGAVQERRAVLGRLFRRYGNTGDEVLAWAAAAAARVAEIDGADERLAALEERLPALRRELATAANALTAARSAAADRLGARVTAELQDLAMGKAVVEVRVSTTEDPDGMAIETARVETAGSPRLAEERPRAAPTGVETTLTREPGQRVRFGPHGIDDVEILLAANPLAPLRSVAKAASGGELSRVMLALEVVAGAGDVPTYVFDEVDAGVGGRAALDVGARLATLARSAQVVVVTHLAQVAAFADRHLVVHKQDDGAVTSSGVAQVEGAARLGELARMMAGGTSQVALDHAQELLETVASRGRSAAAVR